MTTEPVPSHACSAGGIRPGPAGKPPDPDPYKWHAIGMATLLIFTLPMILVLVVFGQPKPPAPAWSVEAAALGVAPHVIASGESIYRSSCALCHGRDGEGIPRLGKPLRNSAYIQGHTDTELLSLIAEGRPPGDPANTTGSAMPARGGRGLADTQLAHVVMYLRAIQDPGQPTISIEEWVLRTPDGAGGVQAAALVGGETGIGHDIFVAACSACHGQSGEGVDGLGKPLSNSAFVDNKTDTELIAFIKMGRPIWDAENTTGLDMPPKGGNPALTDEQLADIVKYIRNIHE